MDETFPMTESCSVLGEVAQTFETPAEIRPETEQSVFRNLRLYWLKNMKNKEQCSEADFL